VIHFISDLHLAPQAPGVSRIFLDYLGGRARTAEQLFILGDLFDVWPGDDCIDAAAGVDGTNCATTHAFNRGIIDALRALADSGVGISLLHGNRDFLLGEEFARRSGVRLRPDPYVLSLPDGQFVLAHGDQLCTDDTDYLAFRAQVRAPAWRADFLAKPLRERQAIASALRQQSERSKREKQQQAHDVMDLNGAATDDFLRANGYATFIHGHTHRPATHDHFVDGIHVERWVLADWHDERGEFLSWDGQRLRREPLR
jgi:UDP-2,3-diacylglucosamine hydrolase